MDEINFAENVSAWRLALGGHSRTHRNREVRLGASFIAGIVTLVNDTRDKIVDSIALTPQQ